MAINGPYEVIIAGGGPAGLTAGLYCKRAALKTVLFEKALPGGQIAIVVAAADGCIAALAAAHYVETQKEKSRLS